MAQHAAKAVSGVQANDDGNPGHDFGAVPGNDPMSTTFDAALSKANLLRLRADYRRAEDICIGILKTYPNSAATHSLLGDIYSDQGLLEQAAQWYELSLDLDPNSLADKQKLDDVRDQINERDHISAVAQLGLPSRRVTKPSWSIAGVAVVLIMAAILGYAIRYGRVGGYTEPVVVKTPVKAIPDNILPNPMPGDHRQPTSAPTLANLNAVGDGGSTPTIWPKDDDELKSELSQKSKWGPRLMSLTQDLRTKVTTLIFESVEGEDVRTVAADLAKTLLGLTNDPESVLVRAKREDKVVYQAEVPRDKYADTLTDDWQQKNTDPDAWISYILTNELWEKAAADAASAAASNATADTNPAGSSETATPAAGDKKDDSKDHS